MKKHDEGYALVFVLIVMTVLSTVALTLMTGAMRNLEAETTSVAQMQDKYLAQGEIEKVVALILEHRELPKTVAGDLDAAREKVTEIILTGTNITSSGVTSVRNQYEHQDVKNGAYQLIIQGGEDELEWDSEDPYSCVLKLTVSNIDISIECEITLRGIIEVENGNHHLRKPKIEYNSYTIEYTTTEGGNG